MSEIVSENNEDQLEFPEYVYLDLSGSLAPIAVTLTDRFVNIPQNPSKTQEGDFSLMLKNNQNFRTLKILKIPQFLQRIAFQLSSSDFELIKTLSITAEEKGLSRKEFIEAIGNIIKHLHPNDSTWVNLEAKINQILKEEQTLEFSTSDQKPEIIGAVYKGKFVPFDQLHSLKEEIDGDFDLYAQIGPKPGEYLYRAVDESEWRQIQDNRGFIIALRTQFEAQKAYESGNSQVKYFSNQPEYSGKIIRFKVIGPYFMYKGLQLPRVESQCAHFTKVEVMENGEWVGLE